jgi:hypothetical protein
MACYQSGSFRRMYPLIAWLLCVHTCLWPSTSGSLVLDLATWPYVVQNGEEAKVCWGEVMAAVWNTAWASPASVEPLTRGDPESITDLSFLRHIEATAVNKDIRRI